MPENYRATFQYLGSWAVAKSDGKGAEQIHVVYASPATVGLDDEDCQSGKCAEGLVRDGAGHKELAPGKQALGRRMGLVVVRRLESEKDDLD